MGALGAKMSFLVSAPLIGAGIGMLKVAADFEKSMNVVRVLTKATDEEFEALRQQAKDLGISTVFSASQAADAMGFLARAGFDVNQIMGAMSATLDLAAAAGQDLATTADQMSNIMNVFDIAAEDATGAADVLAMTAASTNTNVTELAEAMSYGGGLAYQFGLTLAETAAIMGAMASAGIKSTRAGTAMRGGLIRLGKPTREAQRTLKRLGVAVRDDEKNIRSLVDILKDLNAAGADATDMVAIFGRIAATGMLAVTKVAGPALDDLIKKIQESGGEAKLQADVMTIGLAGAMKQLRSALEGLAIEVAEAGMLEQVTDRVNQLTKAVRKFAEADPAVLKFLTDLGLILITLGPGLAILARVVSTMQKLIPVMRVGAALLTAALPFADYMEWKKGEISVLGDMFGEHPGPFSKRKMIGYWNDLKTGLNNLFTLGLGNIGYPTPFRMTPLPAGGGPGYHCTIENFQITVPPGTDESLPERVRDASQEGIEEGLRQFGRDIERNFPENE
jgi:TP901 family phage tail tape measure protein